MRKPIIVALATVFAVFLMACGATPKSDTITAGPTGSAAAAAAAASGGNTAPAAETGPKKFAVGQVGTLTMSDGTAGDIVVNSVKAQGKSIVANVMMTCTAGTMKYNPFYWSAIAGDGTKLDAGFDSGVKNQLHSGEIGPGQKIIGNLVFEGTAAQVKGAQISLSPSLSGTVAYWVAP